jgi:sporadic carbohydrate cluster 2OG-Fe(II) oxygenase
MNIQAAIDNPLAGDDDLDMVGDVEGFMAPWEVQLTKAFLRDGHVILPVEERNALKRLRDAIAAAAAEQLGLPAPEGDAAGDLLNGIHDRVPVEQLNDFRLKAIGSVAALPWARRVYFSLARRALETLIGNELAMQRRLNLSIQMPGDDSSLLHVHADVWDGDSPFEVVAWLPLVDCYDTKSMYLLPPQAAAKYERDFGQFQDKSADALYGVIEKDVEWLTVPYGSILLFSQNLMHGNVVNREKETRWSMNCRFKSLLSPYAGKRLGEFFEPISVRAATRLGMSYRFPEGLHE